MIRDVRTRIEVLDRDRCLELLAAGSVGRLAVISGHEPVIFPVNYALHDGRIVFRTAPGAKLQAVDWGTRASFEIDELDPVAREGWSVVAVGRAEEICSARAVAEVAEATGLTTWATGEHDHWVAVTLERLSGRRVRRSS